MNPRLRLEGQRGEATVALPQDLDAITIATSIGAIHVDLASPIPDMLLLTAASRAEDGSPTRMILSPLPSGRLAVGVIHTQ